MRQVTLRPQTTVPPKDPAPSRTAYRLNRLWLTPAFRAFTRVGLPLVFTFGVVYGFLADETRRESIVIAYQEARRSIENRPEFMVKMLAIDGASDTLATEVRAELPIDFPASSFDLDLAHMKEQIEGLTPVAVAHMRIRPGGVLQVDVEERLPVVLWRGPDGLQTLDEEGNPVRVLYSRSERPDLPMIAGEGAERVVPEALALLAAASPLKDRLRGLQRRGERRWDVVLDRAQVIQLPEDRPVSVLESLMARDRAQDLLARHITHVDLRNMRRPTLRLGPQAIDELRRIKSIEAGDSRP